MKGEEESGQLKMEDGSVTADRRSTVVKKW